MSEFFKLHQRQDIVLVSKHDQNFIGVVLGYNEDSYAVRPLAGPTGGIEASELACSEDEVLQKVGSLDFDSLHETETGFDFGAWVETDDF